MALQIRRGSDVDRQGITPKAGEPIFTTDTKKLYIGDGTTVGGIIVDTTAGLSSVVEDTSPQLGGNLDLNNNTINGAGNISITGEISATSIDLKGSIFADDSTLLVDGITGRIVGPVHANVTGDVVGNVTGDVTGNLVGSVTGPVTGDITGSVFSDNSTQILDSINNILTIDSIQNSSGTLDITAASGININRNVATHQRIDLYSPAATGFGTGFVSLNNTHDNQYTNDLTLTRTRGTIGSETSVQVNDKLGGITIQAWDGSAFQQAVIIGSTTQSISSGNVGANFTVATRNGAISTLTTKFEVAETGVVKLDQLSNINGAITVTGTFNANVTGTLDGDVTGSIFSDASTMLIDGGTGGLMCANVDLIGNVGATPSTPGSVDSWLQVKVNGATKYIPLYD